MTDDVIRALKVKGRAKGDDLVAAVGADATAAVESLEASDLAEATPLGHRLTDAGRARAEELFGSDCALLGDGAAPLYEAFTEVNASLKQIVTDWQLRTIGDEQAINDHTDAAYDRAVLARLADADRAVAPTLTALGERLARFDRYRARLGAALEAIERGDTTFVASPAKDSYHTVWFELHEDLILATGRTRAAESLAGRA